LEEQLDEVVSRGWLGDKVIVYLILPTETDWHLVSVVRDIEFSKDVDPRRTALEELIAGPEPGSKLERPLPQGVRVSSLKVDDTGLATVDFSREILDLNVGARLESLAVKAIVNTLTEFPEIDRVQILVGGQTVETLAGHVDITQPIERDTSVILR
jgi:spore germination protein GerM